MKAFNLLLLLLLSLMLSACSNNITIKLNAIDAEQIAPVKVHIFEHILAQPYLIETKNTLFVVDPGAAGNEKMIIEKMQQLGRKDLAFIFITHSHFDHYGAAAALKTKYKVPNNIQKEDALAMAAGETRLPKVNGWGYVGRFFLPLGELLWPPGKIKADIFFDKEFNFKRFGVDAIALHTPGHTPGSSVLVLNDKFIFAGDLISAKRGKPTVQRFYADDWSQIAESFYKVKTTEPELVFPGHGKPVSGSEFQKLVPVVIPSTE